MNSPAADLVKHNQIIRFLMIDNQQNYYNEILKTLENSNYQPQGKLIDDLSSFEKLINLTWDAVIYHNAYDINYKKVLSLLKLKQKHIPVILLTDIDVHSKEALNIYKLDVFSILEPNKYDFISVMLIRAAIFARNLRQKEKLANEVENLQKQSESLVKNTDYPVAIFQEGIHSYANEQYISLFGLQSSDDLIGAPIMDILCPDDTQSFKKNFKSFSKGDFSGSPLHIISNNPLCRDRQLLVQFSSTVFENEPALQAVIIVDGLNQSSAPSLVHDTDVRKLMIEDFVKHLNQSLVQNKQITLLFFILKAVPNDLLKYAWDDPYHYFKQLEVQLNQLSKQPLQRIAKHIYVLACDDADTPISADDMQQLKSKLPRSIRINHQDYATAMDLAMSKINHTLNVSEFAQIINRAQQQINQTELVHADQLHAAQPSTPIAQVAKQVIHDEPRMVKTAAPSVVQSILSQSADIDPLLLAQAQSLEQQLNNNSIQLRYQQIYDKENINLHFYEISASFKHLDQQLAFFDCQTLFKQFPALSINVHRWLLVEASKQLHNHLLSAPKAKISVSLHSSCFEDNELLGLFSKLIGLINSKYKFPILLNLNEQDVIENLEKTKIFCQKAHEQGMALALRNFGNSPLSHVVLKQLEINYAMLAPAFSNYLATEDGLVALQERLDELKSQRTDVMFVLCNLNDMHSFANAWSIDIRYLQGDYFQSQQNGFVDSAV